MNVLEEYRQIILSYCSDKGRFINDFSQEYETKILNAFVMIMKLKINEYKEIIETIEVDFFGKNSLERLIFLECKIRYFATVFPKEVFFKKDSPLVSEFISLCEEALTLFPFAFVASNELALRLECQKEFIKSVTLWQNIYDFGFKSNQILYSLIHNSILGSDWTKANEYAKKVHPKINNVFTRAHIIDMKFPVLLIPYVILLIYFFLQYFSYIAIIVLLLATFLIVVLGIYYKNRILLTMFQRYIFVFLFLLFFKIFIFFVF